MSRKRGTVFTRGGEVFDQMVREASKGIGGVDVDAGFLPGATTQGKPVAAVAAFNEYGSANVPARPFFRTALEAVQRDIRNVVANGLRANGAVAGSEDALMSTIGETITEAIRVSIEKWSSPGNAPYTIKKKGFDNPLIHTGAMMGAVDWQGISNLRRLIKGNSKQAKSLRAMSQPRTSLGRFARLP